MPTSVRIAVTLSVLLGILVIMLRSGDTDTAASTAADHMPIDADAVADEKHVRFPQVRWNINHGSDDYLAMLDQLRNLARTSADGFADLVISGGDPAPTVHALVRLGDFRVVRFSSSDTPHDFVLNLASDVPHMGDTTDDDLFLGEEGYDALARVARQSETAVNLSRLSLENSLRDLTVRGTDRTAQARGMLRYVIAITEACRFRPVADRIANGMDNGSDVFVTAQQVGVMRD
ncbi:ribosome-inactivating family protein [Streptomyces europaeiscabiei]|uniref:ribosome-inactivating family protein n=1 Tax=Streptomyces TaxID=1883 RepID=UPI000A39E344|nr:MULTISPECIES: ribosome-inactivating family protein [Streptomyces]MDX3589116.1 ribosome-inactivating family protein [Streptomyces europaeiscabiei]MDX3612343.1 ribosome-inactivating family protein [Streptomyces europaeiscabiei]MDX3632238.1 ribosome-inactivating family protein [Streptomyces europaeiscabiei]MDX3649669.1 ribosome-inactivating family protein [Streptomyces europaeiscabiei]WUD37177.1 ribosome-inactivating family protein [Streptomyces europaeiscabiei]